MNYVGRALKDNGEIDVESEHPIVHDHERAAFADLGCKKIAYTFADGSVFEIEAMGGDD